MAWLIPVNLLRLIFYIFTFPLSLYWIGAFVYFPRLPLAALCCMIVEECRVRVVDDVLDTW